MFKKKTILRINVHFIIQILQIINPKINKKSKISILKGI